MVTAMTRLMIVFTIVVLGFQIPVNCMANGKLSFIVGKYYFELLLGQKYSHDTGKFEYDYFSVERLQQSHVKKEHFKHILRVELLANDQKYDDLEMDFPAPAKESWNPSKEFILVTFSGRAMIMSPDYCILKCYQNVEFIKWISDYEIFASVETGNPGLYGRENFIINIKTDVVRAAPEEQKTYNSE
ncbi:MAG: hypothetical protein KAV42_08290 [Candidatus Krumholzibacteria bacterium]|nr:hypothetical protein [Candidatus Krumholzibacteria bacterium]